MNNFLNNVSKANRQFIRRLIKELNKEEFKAEKLYKYLSKKSHQPIMQDFGKLPKETKISACVDSLAISLAGNDVSRDEIVNLLKK
ncbi:MAG: hypothetical protein ABH832_01345 [bacterium]